MERVSRRRALAYAAGFVVLAACGRERVTEAKPEKVDADGAREGDPLYVREAKAYLVLVPEPARRAFASVAAVAPVDGLVAFSERCPREGCKVEFCGSSGWFECPCCGSRWTGLGDWTRGPAPRGLDLHALDLSRQGDVTVSTKRVNGFARGALRVEHEPRGPHCR